MKFSWYFCKPSCAMCCTVTSIVGIIFLVGLGAAYQSNLPELAHGPKDMVPVNAQDTAMACFIAAGMYVGCLALSLCQTHLHKQQLRQAQL